MTYKVMKYQIFNDRKNYTAKRFSCEKISVPKFNPYLLSDMEDPLQWLTPATL